VLGAAREPLLGNGQIKLLKSRIPGAKPASEQSQSRMQKKTSSPREGGELGAGRKLDSVVVRRVLIYEGLEFLRQFFEHEDRTGGAYRDASAAINAFPRIHVQLRGGSEIRFILGGMNAIDGASLDTVFVFRAGVSNDVGHDA